MKTYTYRCLQELITHINSKLHMLHQHSFQVWLIKTPRMPDHAHTKLQQ